MPLPSPVLSPLALSLLLNVGGMGVGTMPQHLAQVQKFILGPGSSVGAKSIVVPVNCYRARDGVISCDTKVVNPPSTTEARPSYSPFSN